jgi:hypothetical protein
MRSADGLATGCVVAAVAGALLMGCAPLERPAAAAQSAAPRGASPSPVPAAPTPTLTPASVRPAAAEPPRAPEPVSIRIPAAGIDTALERLRVDRKGVLQPPRDPGLAGWFAIGTRPGEIGPAVIAGHVDSRSGPAVFARLKNVRNGDLVEIRRADRSLVRFRIVERRHFARDDFPAETVYGPTPDRALRLITCAGRYRAGGYGYADNLVVTAVAAGA